MEQTSAKKWTRLDGKGDPLEFVQEIEIWPNYQMVYAQIKIRLGK